jgi:hypothetical protein
MNTRKSISRWLVSVALGTVAPLVLAQITPGTGGMHGHESWRNNPQFQECSKQADEKKLPRGEERKAFMKQCLQSKPGAAKDAAKSEELREKMREGQSGHLHSDPPPAAAPPASQSSGS